jgi:hypothetical protein
MRRWLIVRSFVLVLAAVFVANQAAPQAQAFEARDRDDERDRSAQATLTLPVTGTVATGGTFTGMLTVQRFARRGNQFAQSGNQVVAVGVITGTVEGRAGILVAPVEVPVTINSTPRVSFGLAPSGATAMVGNPSPAAPQQGFMLVQAPTCGVLHLELGAITLNILGLVITTSSIVLDILGETGGTNLLGTLVCQILALGTGAVNTLVGLLNQLLGVLGGLTGGLPI